MKNKTYTLNTVLIAVFGAVLLAMVALRAFAPNIILPVFDIPTLTAISLTALVLDHYLAPGAKRCWICIPVFAALTFGVLPMVAMLVRVEDALSLMISGTAVFSLCTFVFTDLQDRLSTGPAARLAPVMSALGIWLAVQAFAGIGF
ncbi:MAG: hypothetical protein IKD27_07105 [Oscillospiraceae bacterium]|nr:hypothetical protein [Oscillospiraceae bacterium]